MTFFEGKMNNLNYSFAGSQLYTCNIYLNLWANKILASVSCATLFIFALQSITDTCISCSCKSRVPLKSKNLGKLNMKAVVKQQ